MLDKERYIPGEILFPENSIKAIDTTGTVLPKIAMLVLNTKETPVYLLCTGKNFNNTPNIGAAINDITTQKQKHPKIMKKG